MAIIQKLVKFKGRIMKALCLILAMVGAIAFQYKPVRVRVPVRYKRPWEK